MTEFFDIKDIRKINFRALTSQLPGRSSSWNPFSTRGRYVMSILRSYDLMLDHNINTGRRLAHFIGQGLIETNYLQATAENLNYSQSALLRVFRRHFESPAEAADFARNPERIANRVYSNRLGNGDEASGDGWRYRGRGFFQLTGKDNYRRYGDMAGIDLVSDPEILERDFRASLLVAAAYFDQTGLGVFADEDNAAAVSRGVNRGDPTSPYKAHGEADRILWTRRVSDIVFNPGKIYPFNAAPALEPKTADFTVGDEGDGVRKLQEKLAALDYAVGTPDGVFGQNTRRAVINFQDEHGLPLTGVADSKTLSTLTDVFSQPKPVAPSVFSEPSVRDLEKAGDKQVDEAEKVGAAGVAIGAAGAAGAAVQTGAGEAVMDMIRGEGTDAGDVGSATQIQTSAANEAEATPSVTPGTSGAEETAVVSESVPATEAGGPTSSTDTVAASPAETAPAPAVPTPIEETTATVAQPTPEMASPAATSGEDLFTLFIWLSIIFFGIFIFFRSREIVRGRVEAR